MTHPAVEDGLPPAALRYAQLTEALDDRQYLLYSVLLAHARHTLAHTVEHSLPLGRLYYLAYSGGGGEHSLDNTLVVDLWVLVRTRPVGFSSGLLASAALTGDVVTYSYTPALQVELHRLSSDAFFHSEGVKGDTRDE